MLSKMLILIAKVNSTQGLTLVFPKSLHQNVEFTLSKTFPIRATIMVCCPYKYD